MKSKKLDACKHDMSHLSTIQRLKSLQHQFDHAEMNLACVRLARQQGNLDLASRLLISQLNRLKPTFSSSPNAPYSLDQASLYECFQAFQLELNEATAAYTTTTQLINDLKTKLALVDCEREACKLFNLIEASPSSQTMIHSIQMLADCVFRFIDTNVKVKSLKISFPTISRGFYFNFILFFRILMINSVKDTLARF